MSPCSLLFLATLLAFPGPRLHELPVRRADAREVSQQLDRIFTPRGSAGVFAVWPVPETNRVRVLATDDGAAEVRRLLRPPSSQPRPGSPEISLFPLERGDAEAVATMVNGARGELGLGPLRLVAIPETNSLLLESRREDAEALGPLLRQLDEGPFRPRAPALPCVLGEVLLAQTFPLRTEVELGCHLVEGLECLLDGDGPPHERRLHGVLSRLTVYSLGYKYVEHAKGNSVRLRVERGEPGTCPITSVDWGGGWESLPGVEAPGASAR